MEREEYVGQLFLDIRPDQQLSGGKFLDPEKREIRFSLREGTLTDKSIRAKRKKRDGAY